MTPLLALLLPVAPLQDSTHSDRCPVECRPCQEFARVGLEVLAEQQKPDGRWTNSEDEVVERVKDLKVVSTSDLPRTPMLDPYLTAVCVLALLADGSTWDRGRYARHIRQGGEFLLSCVEKDGGISAHPTLGRRGHNWIHPIGLIGLCMAVESSRSLRGAQRDRYLDAIRRAAEYLAKMQRPDGGFGYTKRMGKSMVGPAVAVLCALLCARRVTGEELQPQMWRRAVDFVLRCQHDKGGLAYSFDEREAEPGPGQPRIVQKIKLQSGRDPTRSAWGLGVLLADPREAERKPESVDRLRDYVDSVMHELEPEWWVPMGESFYNLPFACYAVAAFFEEKEWRPWLRSLCSTMRDAFDRLDDKKGRWIWNLASPSDYSPIYGVAALCLAIRSADRKLRLFAPVRPD